MRPGLVDRLRAVRRRRHGCRQPGVVARRQLAVAGDACRVGGRAHDGRVGGHDYPVSPVPADADLWPGELPFTAFGWVGEDHLDLRVFDQGTYWVDRWCTPHLIADMPAAYISNVIGFLLENAEYFHMCTARRMLLQIYGDNLLGRPSGDVLSAAAGVPLVSDLAPDEWLESTVLMRALRRQERG